MARSSSSRSSLSHRSSRRNPPCGFHCVAPYPAGCGRERHRVPIDANEAYRLYRRYEAAPCDVKLPDRCHLNPNRVPIPPPPTCRERSLAIADRWRHVGPELLEDPRYARERPAWDALFQGEHEATRHSFTPEPPEWFLRDNVSPPGSDDDRDAASSDDELYQCLSEEMPPPVWWKKGSDGGSGGGCAGASSSSAPVINID